MSRPTIALGVLLLGTACSLPPFEHEGEHVVVATDLVNEVCAGTLERLDRGVGHIDEQLNILAPSERLQVAILDVEDVRRLCPRPLTSCAYQVGTRWVAILQPSYVEGGAIHELVHTHLGKPLSGAVPLFSEGVAVALSPAICPPRDVDATNTDELLALASWDQPSRAGYYLGGELITWLLDVHGPEAVVDFLSTLQRPELMAEAPDPTFVRATYRSHFGAELDDDLHAHLRNPDELSPLAVGCVAPEASWEGGQIRLQADLDCDSPLVENDFKVAGRLFVEWTLRISQTQAGSRYRLLDALPTNTALTLYPCTCDSYDSVEQPAWTDESAIGANIELAPGIYRIRWRGPVGGPDTKLDVRVEAYSN